MTQFIISVPYLSPNLKRSYNKDYVIIEKSETGTISHTFNPKSKTWKESKSIASKYHNSIMDAYKTSISDVIPSTKGYAYLSFQTKEEAYLAKAYLIDKMRRRYEEEVKAILDNIARNVPDLSNIIDDLHNQYPEYFL